MYLIQYASDLDKAIIIVLLYGGVSIVGIVFISLKLEDVRPQRRVSFHTTHHCLQPSGTEKLKIFSKVEAKNTP